MSALDRLGRPLGNLRLSVTDRCNLRCAYCMPEEEYRWLPRNDILRFEEISALVDAFMGAGVDRVRITGGEPLLRRDLDRLVALLAAKPALRDLALTTNGILLAEQAQSLSDSGLKRITVSLDTLRPERFLKLARRSGHERVLEGIAVAARLWPGRLKLDSVILKGTNDDEIVPLIEHARAVGAEVRFIEYMDVGGATQWSMDQVCSRAQMLAVVADAYGPATPLPQDGTAPAERFLLPDGTVFGIIASTTAPFCRSCDRSRVTADGMWFSCLYAPSGTDLRTILRAGAGKAAVTARILGRWRERDDRGAEQRLESHDRAALASHADLIGNPHLEMHKRGG